jgi:hypothetical protein
MKTQAVATNHPLMVRYFILISIFDTTIDYYRL